MNNISDLCSCSICYSFIEDQIYQCENGHIYCNICVNNISHCGTCRNKNYKIRNLVLESLRDKLKLNNDIESDDEKKSKINLKKEKNKINIKKEKNKVNLKDKNVSKIKNEINKINQTKKNTNKNKTMLDNTSYSDMKVKNKIIKNNDIFIKENFNIIMSNLEYNFDNFNHVNY